MGTTTSRHRRRTTAAIILTGTLALAACSGGDDDASTAAPLAAGTEEQTDVGDQNGAQENDPTETGGRSLGDVTDLGFDQGVIGRDVIIEMAVTMSSDDIRHTVATITASAKTLGGGIASSDVDYGNRAGVGSDEGYAVLVIKVPPASVARLLDGLDDAGVVESINQSAQDVTDQLVDLDVRISNARQSVANVRAFMDRTNNLNELVALEGELTRRQTELERLEAQQRNLGDRVEFSTITINVSPTAATAEPAVTTDDTIGDAFRTGWDAFVGLIFVIAFVLAISLPFLLLGLLALGLLWIALRAGRIPRRPDDRFEHGPADGDHDDGAAADVSAPEDADASTNRVV
jgi:hypothetical protein